jgi:lipoyl-dependent peroxiredoxin
MASERKASVTWRGSLMEGEGTVETVTSGLIDSLDVDWANRTGEQEGKTSPEELIAAAHAACFSMALSHALAEAGTEAERLETSATVSFVPGTGITNSVLSVRGTVPGIDADRFRQLAEEAKDGCPVSKALSGNVELSVDAELVGAAQSV